MVEERVSVGVTRSRFVYRVVFLQKSYEAGMQAARRRCLRSQRPRNPCTLCAIWWTSSFQHHQQTQSIGMLLQIPMSSWIEPTWRNLERLNLQVHSRPSAESDSRKSRSVLSNFCGCSCGLLESLLNLKLPLSLRWSSSNLRWRSPSFKQHCEPRGQGFYFLAQCRVLLWSCGPRFCMSSSSVVGGAYAPLVACLATVYVLSRETHHGRPCCFYFCFVCLNVLVTQGRLSAMFNAWWKTPTVPRWNELLSRFYDVFCEAVHKSKVAKSKVAKSKSKEIESSEIESSEIEKSKVAKSKVTKSKIVKLKVPKSKVVKSKVVKSRVGKRMWVKLSWSKGDSVR